QPILWWSPDPRAVLYPHTLRVSRSLRRTLKRGGVEVTVDRAFAAVVASCASPRPGAVGTWSTPEMAAAYGSPHRLGWAHSIETWRDDVLVGGLYEVAIGHVFFGESMFSRVTDASKVALVGLVRRLEARGFELIDCQVASEHLASLGAVELPRRVFLERLAALCEPAGQPASWRED